MPPKQPLAATNSQQQAIKKPNNKQKTYVLYNTHAMHALPFDTELTVHRVHKHLVRNASASQPARPVQVEICRDK